MVMIVDYTWTAPLIGGFGDEKDDDFFDKKKYMPDPDPSIRSLKYKASLCIFRIISLA